MTAIRNFIIRKHGRNRVDVVDFMTYLYLVAGVLVMFGPVLWVIMSSFKTRDQLFERPPRILPYKHQTVVIEGFNEDQPLELYDVEIDGETKRLAKVNVIASVLYQFLDPENLPDDTASISRDDYIEYNLRDQGIDPRDFESDARVEKVTFATDNYRIPLQESKTFRFDVYLKNSVIVTLVATIITLVINSMAAFALSKYKFAGRDTIFVIIIGTLMIPISVILVPVFLVITQLDMNNTLWGVIIPGAATPTGVFLLRQYMLTIPDELIESARIDGASEWRIYWQIILPLARPALAVLAIFSVMWRWNDFLWPLIVLQRNELFTLQLGLNAFQGELQIQWDYVLAMTVVTLLPITIVFAFLQRFITSGIATTGMKG